MVFKMNSIFLNYFFYFSKLIFTKTLRRNILKFFCLIISLSFLFALFDLKAVEASTINKEKLIEKISKDFTNKFCNSVAFGLSKDSAMNFANKENNQIFKLKKGVESLDKDLIANSISISVIENCGYLVDLKGEEGISKFRNDYVLLNKAITK